jgi:hypothetical protein
MKMSRVGGKESIGIFGLKMATFTTRKIITFSGVKSNGTTTHAVYNRSSNNTGLILYCSWGRTDFVFG